MKARLRRASGRRIRPKTISGPLALLAQGLTAESDGEKLEILGMLATTHNGTYHMHESFDKDDLPALRAPGSVGRIRCRGVFLQNFELFRNTGSKNKNRNDKE